MVLAFPFNLSSREAEAGKSLEIKANLVYRVEFQDNQGIHRETKDKGEKAARWAGTDL